MVHSYETPETNEEYKSNRGQADDYKQVWDIGYCSSDNNDFEEEEDEEEPDTEYLKTTYHISQKIRHQKPLTDEELEEVAENEQLQNAFQNRWYSLGRPESDQTYFVFYNASDSGMVKAGGELLINYGLHSNASLLENYGFILKDKNPNDTF